MSESSLWNENRRKLTWLVMLRMRFAAGASVNPTVATAFVILQKYFKVKDNPDFKLYVLVIASYLIAFKNEDLKCDTRIFFDQFLGGCRDYVAIHGSELIKSIFEIDDISPHPISSAEESKVNDSEMDILDALNFDVSTELPFYPIEEAFLKYAQQMEPQEVEAIVKEYEKEVCAFFSSDQYLDLPILAMAVIAMFKTILKGKNIPQETKDWVKNAQTSLGKETLDHAIEIYRYQIQMLAIKRI